MLTGDRVLVSLLQVVVLTGALAAVSLSVLVPTVLVAGFTPFLILRSYIVRLTVVARWTADNFPFSSQLRQTVALRDAFTDEE